MSSKQSWDRAGVGVGEGTVQVSRPIALHGSMLWVDMP